MKSKVFFFLLVASLFYGYAAAQPTIGKKLMIMPASFMSPDESAPDYTKFLATNAPNLWIVYSESEGVFTSTAPGDTKANKKMAYMEPFYVIDQKGDWIHIVKWEQLIPPRDIDAKTMELKKELESYGWVQMDKMLLWRHCLVDPQTRFTIKALTASNQDCVNHPELCSSKTKILKLYSNPGLTVENKNDVRLFEFLYIYKHKGNSVLVGRMDQLTVSESKFAKQRILGWLPKSVVKEWKQRLVLEPNSDPAAVAERKSKKTKAQVFLSQDAAKSFLEEPSNTEAFKEQTFWEIDPYEKPWAPELKRFPLLDANVKDLEANVLRTGAVTPIFNREGKPVFETSEEVALKRESNDQRERFRKINIVFLIDGSLYMKPHQTGILRAATRLAESIQQAEAQNADDDVTLKNTFKLGAVIYRGSMDKNCNGENLQIQTQELTSNYNEVGEFLQDKFQKTGCSDKIPTTSYYQGYLAAIRLFASCKRESNIIVVIGGAGNSEDPGNNSIKRNVLNGLVDYQVGILAFQVVSAYEKAYSDFILQTKDLIYKTAGSIMDSVRNLTNTQFEAAMLVPGNNLWKLRCPDNSPIPGEIMYTTEAAPMHPDTLLANVLGLKDETLNSKEAILQGIDSKLNGMGTKMPVSPGMMLYLKNMNVDEATLRKASYENVQLYLEGYTAFKPTGFSNPLFKLCVFMSEPELSNLTELLRNIQTPNEGNADVRSRMETGFKAIVTAYFGKKEAQTIINNKTGAEIMAMLSGLPTKNPVLQKFKIDQIKNKKMVSDAELVNLGNEIEEKMNALNQFAAEEKNFFKSGDKKFAWVPAEYFP